MSRSIEIRIFVWIYLLNITAVVVHGQIPLPNAVVVIKGQTMLDCHSTINDLPVSYWRYSSDGTIYSTISVGCNNVTGNNAAYYKTEVIGGTNCRLTIANVTMQQAGVYECYGGSAGTGYKGLITVIDPVASVVVYNGSVVVERDQLIITCSINYNGPASPAPSLRPLPYWETSPEQIFTSAISHPSTTVVTLTATVTVQKPTVPIFQCNTLFNITGNTTGYNAIPPSDNFTVGSTAELDVQYRPSTPLITSRPEGIAIDGVTCGISVLTCSSTGNPIPNYRWFDTAENVILSSTNTLTLAEVKRNYKCEAYNTIRNELNSTSVTTTVTTDNCTSTAGQQCCVFPRDETTSVTVDGCYNGTLCDCSNGTSGIRLICNATTFPNASYMWTDPDADVIYSPIYDKVTGNETYRCTAYFDQVLSNYTGSVAFSNGTNDSTVSQCSNPDPSSTPTPLFTITTNPDDSSNPMNGTGSDFPVGAIVGAVIGVIVIANIVATGLFFWYYKNVEESHSGKIERNNKSRLDRTFPWLKKMIPCVSDTKESTGNNCLWVSLFILLGIVTGIVTFPIWIILAKKYEKNNETSALNRRENGDGNRSGENGRRPANTSSSNHSQPQSTNQMNAIRREDPYQNESSRENIELNNSSLRSRNLLLPGSPPSRPPPAGRPPPPPNKPTMNISNSRSKDYTANDETQAANPEHTTYADLPFVERNTLPTATPVQFLNVSNDTYAELNKT